MSNSSYLFSLIFFIILIFCVYLSIGVLNLRINYFLNAVHKLDSPEVLLTFDDGPDPETTPLILDTLNQHGIKAIFFIIGSKAERYPEIVMRIIRNGHIIGNHTYSHSIFFPLSSTKRVREEIKKTNDIIRQFTEKENILFRPPIGFTNPIIARVACSMNMKVIGWNRRSYDTLLSDTKRLKKRVLKLTKPGSIILLHDNLKHTGKMLPLFITEAKKNGIIFANEKCIKSLLA